MDDCTANRSITRDAEAGQRDIGAVQAEAARLQTGRVQQVVDHLGETVGLLFDDLETVADGALVPLGIVAPQGGRVAFDQRDGRPQFVADDGDERALDLVRVAEVGDVAHGHGDVAQFALGVEQGRVRDAHGDGRRLGAFEVAFDVERRVRGQRPAVGEGLLEGGRRSGHAPSG